MRQSDVMTVLSRNEAAIRSLGVGALYLFGSYARDDARADSDVDVFIDKDPSKPFGFMEYTGLIIMLEDLFGTEVDVATRSSLHPLLRADIEASAIKVF